jgi:pyruvate,orthophosphate dikinase
MDGLPVTIRLLDPPLHEFLPTPTPESAGGRGRARQRRAPSAREDRRAARVQPDARPPRLPARHHVPEIYRMQARAIAGAAREVPRRAARSGPRS